ncbi:glutathione peroxidase [Gynurincola endophyticus]|jgi:glutathione peroxidase|uniref:glutathione peroxidase n=1 Tax=Gynurincola endophyticus TaxID=2479004 RepID=UPI000F8E39E0|nr:glutathione peroxidase [Gynurincola endophyticus]
MKIAQKIKKWLYPVIMKAGKAKFDGVLSNVSHTAPPESIYDLNIILNNQQSLALSVFKGKKILLVNTASDCGFTAQYEDLQKLSEAFADTLTIIGFPANDFKEQEKGTDSDIAAFCKMNYGVKFPLAAKSIVVKHPSQNKVFEWLTTPAKNGWNDQAPVWNFSKYLVDENGYLANYFPPTTAPLSEEILAALKS